MSSRLRFAILGIGFGSLLAVGSGCPTILCPNCKIKRAEFGVTQIPAGTEIVRVEVSAQGEFTGHCPDPKKRSDCNITGTFTSPSTSTGSHQVTLEGWPFDDGDPDDPANTPDTVTATATVILKDVDGGPTPPAISIPARDISFSTVETGDF